MDSSIFLGFLSDWWAIRAFAVVALLLLIIKLWGFGTRPKEYPPGERARQLSSMIVIERDVMLTEVHRASDITNYWKSASNANLRFASGV